MFIEGKSCTSGAIWQRCPLRDLRCRSHKQPQSPVVEQLRKAVTYSIDSNFPVGEKEVFPSKSARRRSQIFHPLGFMSDNVFLVTYFHAGFFLGLFRNSEDGVDMFLRNVGILLTDYTAFIFK
jgi:hypothetical protein